jgi:Dolichyl-phosphate-mannose-protein mannosyltransferase
MKLSRETLPALALLLTVLVVNAVGLWPELSISRVDLNDNVLHFTLVERIVQAVERGENPLDCWSPEWSLGYPVLRTYQPLAHAMVALAYFALGKSVGLMTVFVWVRFLSVVLLPLSFFAAARLMGLRPLTAAAAAMLAPLVSTNFLYGVEYGSYTWAGSGLFPQAVGNHFLLITLGLAFYAIRRGRHLALTGALLGLTFLAHLIYGYMGALSVCLLAVMPDAEVARAGRIRRAVMVGGVALLLSAFQLAPLLLDGSNINHSRWEPVWKWDSFGAGEVVKWLFTGKLLDYGRLPVLTLLAFAGAGLFAWNWRKRRPACAAHTFVLWGAAFWTLLFFGRPFWGPLLSMLGVSADMQLHRVIGGAQIFLVLLAAIALGALWRLLSQRWHVAAAVAATLLLLYPMVQERARNLANDGVWGRKNLAAYEVEKQSLEATIAAVKDRGGRGYSGLAAAWGGKFKVGDVPFYAFLSTANVPAVAFLFHAMSLTADIMVRFDEWNMSHYRLFNIRTVVAPAGADPVIPPFLVPLGRNGRFRIFEAPGNSYFDLVDVLASVKTTKNNFYDVNDRWLQSDWVMKRAHLRLDRRDDVSPQIARLAPEDALPTLPMLPSAGEVRSEQRNGEVYRAEVEALRPCFALFKMTWHANWKADVDGRPQETRMLTPGFVGVPLTPGRHSIVMRYQPESWKAALGFAGLFGVVLLIAVERRAWLARAETWAPDWALPEVARRRLLIAGGLILLALPVCIPLFTGSVLWGHDAFVYFPRLVEIHQNLTHGILVPRWAPDLGRGTGQPLFLFHPPMIYFFGEFWRLIGFDFVIAMNLACAAVVLLSAVGMFLLARLYFGAAGGWLGATAYLYAPYFAVDLYVRSAMEEFAAFPFFAFALYGFGAYALHRSSRHWLLGVAAFACVLFCHFPAALLFTPLLLGFLGLTAWMQKSWSVLWRQGCGVLLGLGLSAFIWAPALAARPHAAMDRAVQGNGVYSNHFVYLHQLFYSAWGYGFSVPGPNDGMSFALGWSHLVLIVLVWIWISRNPASVRNVPVRLLRFFGIAAVLLCILTLQDALWFWEQVPLLQNVQLPWRLLGPVAICMALLIAPLGPLLSQMPRWRTLGMTAAMALLILPNLSHLHTKQPVDVDLTFWTPQQLSIRGFETTTMGEVTPRWMPGLPSYTPFAATVLSGNAEIRSPGRTPFLWSSLVTAKVASTIEMNTAWFPGWEVRIDRLLVPAGPGTPSGLITFQLPAGEHLVEVQYGRTEAEKVALRISMASLLVALILAGIAVGLRLGDNPPPSVEP